MSSASKLYLVTGGSGFLGSNLVKALVDRGDRVRVLDNNQRGSIAKLGDHFRRVEFVQADIRDRDAVFRAVEGVDVLCHLAFINGTRYFYEIPDQVLEVGVKGALNTLEAGLQLGVKDYILASSSEVYQSAAVIPTDESVAMTIPDPLNARYSYAGGKLISELLAFNYGRGKFRRTIAFRPHNVYGPDMGFEHVIPEFVTKLVKLSRASPGKRVRFEIQGDGTETRAFNYVADFIQGLLLVVDRGLDQNVYHIGNDEEVAIRRVAELVASKMGVEVEIVPGARLEGSTMRRCPNIDKVRKLGYRPSYALAQGLDPTIAWYADRLSRA